MSNKRFKPQDSQKGFQGYPVATIAGFRVDFDQIGKLICTALFLGVAVVAFAEDTMTVYELLAPETHQFAIRYDVSAVEPGSTRFFNIIRPGSEASGEKVMDRSTGKEIPFEMTTGKEAKAAGQAESDTSDETRFIKVLLPHPVPENGEFRLRILKTYKDPKSYFADGDRVVFERSLSVKRNVIVLPAGYELIESISPVMVDTDANGRIRVSLVNDRDDEVSVRLVGRKLKGSP